MNIGELLISCQQLQAPVPTTNRLALSTAALREQHSIAGTSVAEVTRKLQSNDISPLCSHYGASKRGH
jgi:hypothetical protein